MTMEDRMAQFRQRFLARAVTDADGLSQELQAGSWDDIRRRAHSLAGNAGLFGFGAIGDMASALEQAIDQAEPQDAREARVRALVDSLKALPAPD